MIRIWNSDLIQQRLLPMEDGIQSFSQSASGKHKIWVTDAVIMKNVNKLAISTTNMDIYFYDMSTPVYTPQFHLCGKFIFEGWRNSEGSIPGTSSLQVG